MDRHPVYLGDPGDLALILHFNRIQAIEKMVAINTRSPRNIIKRCKLIKILSVALVGHILLTVIDGSEHIRC